MTRHLLASLFRWCATHLDPGSDPMFHAASERANAELRVVWVELGDSRREIDRLKAAVSAAIGELEHSRPLSAFSFLLNAQEGLE